jgi:hypothetical protein
VEALMTALPNGAKSPFVPKTLEQASALHAGFRPGVRL